MDFESGRVISLSFGFSMSVLIGGARLRYRHFLLVVFCIGVVVLRNFEQHVAVRLAASVCVFDDRFIGLTTVLIVCGFVSF